jgi:KipI family sensor histidine kinase inhibitor
MRLSFADLRDGLVLVGFPDAGSDAANRAAVALARSLAPLTSRGLRDAIPAARTLLLSFDPLRLSHDSVRRAASGARVSSPGAGGAARTLEVAASFDGEDLATVAAAAGLRPRAFVDGFLAAEYRVAFLGFAPGFPYLTGLPERLRASRLATPRLRVPAGSVAIAGAYAGIYPSATPGGWRLVGRTAARLFDPRRDPPALFAAGDRVRFAESRIPDDAATAARREHGAVAGAVFRVARPGLWTAVVGAPRWGLASSGVPPGGAMDSVSAAAANAAVGNPADAGLLEAAVDGPELDALAPCVAAVAGADSAVTCGGVARAHGEPFAVAIGDRVIFGRARKGMRTYLAVGGGLRDAEETAGTRRVERGDLLLLADASPREDVARHRRDARLLDSGPLALRAISGPHATMFTPDSVDAFFSREWRVSPQSDRRGLRLEGAPLDHLESAEVEPVGAAPGSIQVPGGGLPIVLGPDGPVTGGYPRIATVIGADLHLLGRAAPGDAVRFVPATLDEALVAIAASGSTMGPPNGARA